MIEINGIRFPVEVTRKKGMKNLRMRLKENTICISCSPWVPEWEIYRFIESKKEWVYRAYLRDIQRKETSPLYRGGDTFYIFGEEYPLSFSAGKNAYAIRDGVFTFSYKEDDMDKAMRWLYKQLDKKLLAEAQSIMEEYLYLLKDYGYDQIPELKARILKSKWGVCYTKENRITISSYLIHYPEDCLRYIILHEMTHFLVPNHSKRFYEIISGVMPEYKEVVKQLH